MGEPVSIAELAEKMIRLSGKEPGRDVAVKVTGVRPGEKLHEVLWTDGETVEPTVHPKILVAAQAPVDPVWLEDQLSELDRLVDGGETLDLVSRLSTMVRDPQRLTSAAAADRVT